MTGALIIDNVSKKYQLSTERPLLLKNLFAQQKKETVWALKNVSLKIKKGETVGIIGANGSGKSTLLKIIAGVTIPTSGKVQINGKISSLIELGAGFHPDLTGRENVYLNAALLGMTKNEIDKKFKDIAKFADIGEYIDQAVRTYSSGMVVRLGFAVAIHLEPDILLIDEVLAVGDENFRKKCFGFINNMQGEQKTIIFVSHDLTQIRQLCDKVLLLDSGKSVFFGQTDAGLKKYSHGSIIIWPSGRHFVRGIASVNRVAFFNQKGERTNRFILGEKVMVRLDVSFSQKVKQPVFGIVIKDKQQKDIFVTNTLWQAKKTGIFEKGQTRIIDFEIDKSLLAGTYFVSPAIASEDAANYYDWKVNLGKFKVT